MRGRTSKRTKGALSWVLLLSVWSFPAQPGAAPKHEFRGVWIASVAKLEWPSSPSLSPEEQRADVRRDARYLLRVIGRTSITDGQATGRTATSLPPTPSRASPTLRWG